MQFQAYCNHNTLLNVSLPIRVAPFRSLMQMLSTWASILEQDSEVSSTLCRCPCTGQCLTIATTSLSLAVAPVVIIKIIIINTSSRAQQHQISQQQQHYEPLHNLLANIWHCMATWKVIGGESVCQTANTSNAHSHIHEYMLNYCLTSVYNTT